MTAPGSVPHQRWSADKGFFHDRKKDADELAALEAVWPTVAEIPNRGEDTGTECGAA